MKIGSTNITAVYIGSTAINKVYIGSTEIWTSFTGLLDLYPNAAAAYSLRRLSSTYNGPAIQVRNDSNNVLDIGFTSTGELDTVALLAHCGAGNGFVTTWYDQSGNGYDATQTTAANQPQIVSGGSVILQNSKVSISFLSALSGLEMPTFSATSVTMYMVIKAKFENASSTPNNGFVKLGTSTFNNHYPFSAANIFDDSFSTTRQFISSITTPLAQLNLYNVLSINNQWVARLNTNQIYLQSTNTVSVPANPKIGSKSATSGFNAFLSELIIYASDQSSNRTGIENNINTYYSIY